MSNQEELVYRGFFEKPLVGTLLTALASLSFLAVCMNLALVGRSGSVAPHATQNKIAFFGIVFFALALAVLAMVSKLARRRVDESPFPYLTSILAGLCAFLALAALTGLLSI